MTRKRDIKSIFLFFKSIELLFLKEYDPHLLQTILPPNDLSEMKLVHPQLLHTLLFINCN